VRFEDTSAEGITSLFMAKLGVERSSWCSPPD